MKTEGKVGGAEESRGSGLGWKRQMKRRDNGNGIKNKDGKNQCVLRELIRTAVDLK